jgi:hypothetical protein
MKLEASENKAGLWRRVVLKVANNVSEVHISSIFRVDLSGGDTFFWNVGYYL